ncbi:MAG TPA: site-specific DNA-methyltransferase [Phycisphaerales bacterium]
MSFSNFSKSDWLPFARALPRASVDLCYVDPPFNTGVKKTATRPIRGKRATYADSWPTIDAYLAWLRERLAATIPALKATGNLLVHVDWRTSHRVRVLLDELLGPDRFVNHLIWSYGLGGSSPRMFARKHDDILFYCIDPVRHYFDPPRIPATSRRMRGQTKKATDVLDIPAINNMAAERTGYPTQKPLALLELLVAACSPPKGVVLDPCCGSGTTLVAATRLGRTPIGCDTSSAAVRLTQTRLSEIP